MDAMYVVNITRYKRLVSTMIVPPQKKNQRVSLTNVSWPLDTTRKDAIENKSVHIFSCVQRSVDR